LSGKETEGFFTGSNESGSEISNLPSKITSIPLFVFMANICDASRIKKKLYDAAAKLLGHRRVGLGIKTLAASCVFAAIRAFGIASAAIMGDHTINEKRLVTRSPYPLGALLREIRWA